MRRHATFGCALALAAVAAPAGAQVADFREYASPTTTEYQATIGAPVTSGGFDFYSAGIFGLGPARNALGTWGTDPGADPIGAANLPVNLGSSTAMFATLGAGDEIEMYASGSNPLDAQILFNLRSIDIAHLYARSYFQPLPVGLAPFSLTFYGIVGGFPASGPLPVITATFTIPAPPTIDGSQRPVLTTLTFDNRWRGLSAVLWTQGEFLNTNHQFTNVNASVVPEPGTYLLMLTGLGGVAIVALWRRRTAA